jgi:hypothetical protein
MRRASLTRFAATLPLAGAVVVLVAGCGSSASFKNKPRPATPIVVTAAITRSGVTVSPTHFGAGLIQLDIANLTGRSEQLTLRAPGSTQPISQTGPINPQDTAEIRANLAEGSYSVSASDAGLKAATLAVSAARPSSQNQLLQP